MNDWQTSERRYGERLVWLTNDTGERLSGVMYALYPADEPPLVEVPSLGIRWFLQVWRDRGWSVAE